MDERRVRYAAGRNGDGAVHRVGLTRHCLASGRIQLPFALRDAIPEGELLVLDVDRDESLVLESLPPRRLAGLLPFFEAHELEVNDVLEIRTHDAEIRLGCVRRARRERAAAPEAGAADDAAPARTERSGATGARREGANPVVDRIGSVTVRRLGAGTFTPPPAAELPHGPTEDDPAVAEEPAPEEAPPLLVDGPAAPPARPDRVARAAAGIDDAREGRAGPAPGTGAPVAPEGGTSDAQGALFDAAPARAPVAAVNPPDAPAGTAPPDRRPPDDAAPVRESDLLDEARARALDRTGRDAPMLAWLRRPDPSREAAPASPSRPTPRPSPRATGPDADAPGAHGAHLDRHDARRDADLAPRRAREEALSRAGDLRSRIVRWLLDPATPVIVPYERVQHRFDLEPDVARDVLAGIIEDPPPSLRLTVLREGMVRVSRVTVEQEA